jgi:hypothetical protein
MKRFLMLLLIALLVNFGCAKKQTTTEPVTHIVTVPVFAKGAVDAVGGEQAWADTQVILGECIAKFYKSDGTFYLTSHRHAIYPWSDSIRIYASEPQGTFVWQLSGNEFKLLEGTSQQAAQLPITLCDPYIARAIWSITAAPASVATQTDPNTAALGGAVKIEGLWHYPLKLADGRTWYMNKDSSVFDIYTIEAGRKMLMARGYNYSTIEKTGVAVPTKIEIFSVDPDTSAPRLMIELDYHTLKSVTF